MQCSDFQKLISAKLDKELNSEEGQILSRHLETCPACREFEKSLRDLQTSIQTWENVEIPIDLENRILRQTVKSIRKDNPLFGFLRGYYKIPRGLAWASGLLLLSLLIFSILRSGRTVPEAGRLTQTAPVITRVQKIVLTEKDVIKTYTVSSKKNSL